MNKELTLAKIVTVNKKGSLPDYFISDYYPEVDMYIFFTECKYDSTSGSYSGKRLLHDRLIAEKKLSTVSDDLLGYVSVDIKSTDRSHTYLTQNSRYYHLSEKQKEFLGNMFNVDYI